MVQGEAPAATTRRDEIVRQFFLGFIKIHVLHHAAEDEVYGLALIAELRRHGYELSPGSMYPLLHQLEEAGCLRRIDRIVNGKVRKYYAITRAGAGVLADAREKVRELIGEVLTPTVTERGAGVAASPRTPRKSRRATTRHS
jgi:DNA-binding PadR family transcriptional regulator